MSSDSPESDHQNNAKTQKPDWKIGSNHDDHSKGKQLVQHRCSHIVPAESECRKAVRKAIFILRRGLLLHVFLAQLQCAGLLQTCAHEEP